MSKTTRWLAVAAAALALAAACSGSGSGEASSTAGPVNPRAQAAAWLAAHPAREAPGLINAMILPGGFADFYFAGAARRQACPGWPEVNGYPQPPGTHTTAYMVGNLPGCGAWTATALTAAGQVVNLACGSIPGRVECPLWESASGYVPGAGDFLRIPPGGGQITSPADLQVIELFADSDLLLDQSDGDTGALTSPARVPVPGPCGPATSTPPDCVSSSRSPQAQATS